MVYHHESITFYENRNYESSENNLVLPFATNPCDFRKLGNSVCKWNQSRPAHIQDSSSTSLPRD